jgi:hypothetical protein
VFILCRSAERQAKERAMHERFEKRIEEGLLKITASCGKRRQKSGAVERRVGRLLERNSRASRLFDVQVEVQGFAQLRWSKVESWREWARRSEGCYLLRSNVTDWTPEELWRAYVQLTEAEAAFRVHKSDLQIRPVCTTASIAWVHTSWSVFWLTCCLDGNAVLTVGANRDEQNSNCSGSPR